MSHLPNNVANVSCFRQGEALRLLACDRGNSGVEWLRGAAESASNFKMSVLGISTIDERPFGFRVAHRPEADVREFPESYEEYQGPNEIKAEDYHFSRRLSPNLGLDAWKPKFSV